MKKHIAAGLLCSLILIPALLAAQPTIRISKGFDGSETDGSSQSAAVSGTGRYVVYSSNATNIVPGDGNNFSDIFLWDRTTDATTRISQPAGQESNGHSTAPVISRTGRFVAFTTAAVNFFVNDPNPVFDAVLFDRTLGTFELISASIGATGGNGSSFPVQISDNGRFVLFESIANDLVANDNNGFRDVFMRDRKLGTTQRLSVNNGGFEANRTSFCNPMYSMDQRARYIVFQTDATNLHTVPVSNVTRGYLRDRVAGTTTLFTLNADGTPITNYAGVPLISRNAKRLFYSPMDSLVAADTNSDFDVYRRPRRTNTPKLESIDANGLPSQDGISLGQAISENGRYLLFRTLADNFVPTANNAFNQLIVRDTKRKNFYHVTIGADGLAGNSDTTFGGISLNGRWAAFTTSASNVVAGDGNGFSDIFVRKLPVPKDPRN